MAEDSQDVSAPAEESVQTDAAVEQTTEVDSSTTEQTSEQVSDEVATSEDTEQPVEQTQQEEAEANGESEDLAPKSQNRFQKLANENRALKQRLAEMEQLKVPSEQDYIDGGYDPIEAKINALEARQNQREQIDEVVNLNNAIENDMGRIVNEFPQLNPQSKEFNQDLARTLFNQYDQDAGTEYTEDGITLRTNQLPYNYIKNKMELIGLASAKAKVQAQKSVEQMVAAADNPSSKAPQVTKSASEMSLSELEAKLGVQYQ